VTGTKPIIKYVPGAGKFKVNDVVYKIDLRDRAIFWAVNTWVKFCHPRRVIQFLRRTRKIPHPALPTTLAEKFLWRKLFDHNPLFTLVSDKLAAKEYAVSICPHLKVPQTLWTGTNPADISEKILSGSVMFKANHGSGWNIKIHNGIYDRKELLRCGRRWMRSSHWRRHGEWGYNSVVPLLFVEQMVLNAGQPVDRIYKLYISGGKLGYMWMNVMGPTASIWRLFDRDGNYCGSHDSTKRQYIYSGDSSDEPLSRPENFRQLVTTSLSLAGDFDSVRIDLYEADDEIWLSEFTIYTEGGFPSPFLDPVYDEELFRNWDISRSWFMTHRQKGWREIYAQTLKHVLSNCAAQK